MNTSFELRKDGTTWVYHKTDGYTVAYHHPIEKPCKDCPADVRRLHGECTTEGLPDVRDEGLGR